MADNTGIRLLGFKGFEASEHFLRALDDEIWVARHNPDSGRTDIPVHRPEGIDTGDAMRAELEQPSLVTVISAHAGYWDGLLGFCGDSDQPVLMLDKLRTLGAASMLLIDACHAPALAAELKKAHARPGSLIAGLVPEPGEDPITWGRDSVTAVGTVIRELCYPVTQDLSPKAAARAVDLANAQARARNDAESNRGVTNRKARRPMLFKCQC
jgi:hypothetical protein